MKIIINTKFDIGDTVYAADFYGDFYAITTPYIISDIGINIINQNIHITYYVKQNGTVERFPEDWIFTSYEECAKWCEKHN